MSEMINKFNVLNDLSDDFKQNIELFYIFGDYDKENNKWTEKRNVLIVTKNDEVYAFGGNTNGILGLGHNNCVTEPTNVNELCDKNIVEFKSGWTHCMARTYYGKIYSFGMNFWGHLGIGKKDNDFHKPELINHLNEMKIVDMCCGGIHSLVLTNLGEVYAWGNNVLGQIGVEGCENVQLVPIKVIGFNSERVVMISCGIDYSLALTECGHVFRWGYNDCGQLGYMKSYGKWEWFWNNKRKIPEIVSVRDNKMNNILIKKISSGANHNLLLTNDGDIYTFGSNEFGQLGDNSQVNRTKPMK
jgi:alpha-tubulin suppressor-like RCC1 family protein